MLQMEKLRPREFSYLVKVTKSLSHGTMGLDPAVWLWLCTVYQQALLPKTATFGEIPSEDNSSLRTKHLSFMATLS